MHAQYNKCLFSNVSPIIAFILALVAVGPARSAQGPPIISVNGVLNAADYSISIAPGAMIAIFGSDLASETTVAPSVPLPLQIGDKVKVEVIITDGSMKKRAAIWFASKTQINAQLPFDLSSSSISVQVHRGNSYGNTVSVRVSSAGPALFTWSGTGRGDVAALHNADWSLVNEGNPALPGEYLILYATGLGPVNNTPPVGSPGGDNGAWGPVNYSQKKISVTIGGVPATPVFAGLAPGFVGLYQINVQVPSNAPSGQPLILVRAGIAQSRGRATLRLRKGGTTVGGKPENVVQRALEAQVRGDVNGFLAECTLAGYSDDAIAGARKLLNVVRTHATLSDFQFTHRATGYDEGKTMAVVRAIITFTAATADGSHSITEGVLSFLKKVNDQWKIVRIVPDDMLNQMLYEDSVAHATTVAGSNARYTGTALNLEQFNDALDKLLGGTYLNGGKLAQSITFGVIGQVPVVGDTIADVNQVIESGGTGWEALQEIYHRGLTGVALIKIEQVGVGILQIVTEPIPGVDAEADAMGAAMDQLAHNIEITRDLCELKRTIRQIPDGQVQLHPYLFQYPAYLFRYPAGLEMEADPSPPALSFGTPVARLRVTAPAALDQQVPLMIVGEIPFNGASPAAALALELGGQRRGGMVYVPVEVGFMAQSDASKGDVILDDYQRYRTDTSVSRVVSWDVTCRRGRQEVAVRLRNGETTPPVIVWNEFMNNVTELQVTGAGEHGIEVAEKASVTGFRVIGNGPLLEPRFYPDLTNRGKCLDMAISNPDIASLNRGDTLAVNGIKQGDTTLNLLLIGSADPRANAPEIQDAVPIHVTGESGALYHDKWTAHFYNGWWQADVDLTISSVNGTASFARDSMLQQMRLLDFTTSAGGDYTISVSVSGVKRVDGNEPKNLFIKGSMDDGGHFSVGTNFSRTVTITPGSTPFASVYFAIIVYKHTDQGEEVALASDNLFRVQIGIP